MIEAQWLFENHLNHLALKKYLLARMEHMMQPSESINTEEISSQALSRPPLDTPPQKTFHGSSTERIALLLYRNSDAQSKELFSEYEQLLLFCRFLIELYEAVLVSLTSKEAWLVDALYHQGWTMETIQCVPNSPYGFCDRSTVYRMKKRIIKKADSFIQIYIPKEVSQCRLEKFMNRLKQFQDRNIMS